MTQSTHQIAASKSSGRVPAYLVAEISQISNAPGSDGAVKVIASIEDPVVIKQILAHLERKAESKEFTPLPECRAPPKAKLFV